MTQELGRGLPRGARPGVQVWLSPLVWREPSTRRRPLDRVPAAGAPSRHRGPGTGRLPQRHCSRTRLSWQLLPVFSESWFPDCIRVHFCKTVISAVKSTQSSQEGRPRRKGQVGSMWWCTWSGPNWPVPRKESWERWERTSWRVSSSRSSLNHQLQLKSVHEGGLIAGSL